MCISLQFRGERLAHCWKPRHSLSGASTSTGEANPKHLDRDIVRPTPLQSHRDQGSARSCGRLAVDGPKYFLIGHQPPQSVGTEYEGVALLHNKRLLREVDRYFASRAQSGRKNVTLGMGLRVFRAYDATLDQSDHICVIAGKP